MATKLKKELTNYAIKKDLPWFDGVIEDILTSVGSVLQEDFEQQKCARYANMEVGA